MRQGLSSLATVFRGNAVRARLVRGALGSAGVQVASRALAVVIGVVLARSLGPEGLGVYAYALAIMSLLLVVAEAGVPTLLMREVAAAEGRGAWGLLRGALRRGLQFVTMVSITIAALGLVVVMLLADSMTSANFHTYKLMLVVLPVVAITKTVGHALWGLQRVVTAQIVLMLISPILVFAILLVVFYFAPEVRGPSAAMAAQLAAAFATLFISAVLLTRAMPTETNNLAPTFQSRKWLQTAFPFILIGGANIITTQTDVIMLGWFASQEEVGIYRVATQGALLVPAITIQIGNALLAPHFARLYAQKEMAGLQIIVSKSIRTIMTVAVPIVLFLTLLGESIISWLFGAQFAPAYALFLIFILTQLVVISFGQVDFLLNMTGHERLVNRVLWQTACLNVLLNLILIPLFFGLGAALATAASLTMRALLLKMHVKHGLGLQPTVLAKIS